MSRHLCADGLPGKTSGFISLSSVKQIGFGSRRATWPEMAIKGALYDKIHTSLLLVRFFISLVINNTANEAMTKFYE